MSELHVLFQLAGAEYAVAADDVLHMEAFTGATRVPGAPAYVAGLVQTRGRVVPVVDLRARLGLEKAEPTVQSRVVVVRHGERVVGLLVDSAREVMNIPEDRFRPPPEVVARQAEGFVRSVAQAGSRLVMVLDFSRIIGEGRFPWLTTAP